MRGFGLGPCGKFPFGFGAPDTETTLETPTFLGARYISPVSGDYQADTDTGQFVHVTPAEQAIILALGSRKGSGIAMPNFGMEFPLDINDQTERAVKQGVAAALQPDVDAGVLTISDVRFVTAANANGRATIEVDWVDHTTGTTGTTPING